MKVLSSLLALIFIRLLSAPLTQAQPQSWVAELWQSNPDPDSLVANLELELESAEGEDAPSFSFDRLDGDGAKTLSDYEGQTVVVNFWKTNCSGCKMQFPHLSNLQKTYADQGLKVIYLSPQEKSTIQRFWEKHDIAGLVGQINKKELTRPYQLLATPSAFVVDPDGKVREAWIRPETFEQLEARVTPYLSARSE